MINLNRHIFPRWPFSPIKLQRGLSPMAFLAVLGMFGYSAPAQADLYQYADKVIDFSSEYSVPNWAAYQALGQPDTFSYGDIITAWAPRPINGTLEFITVGFPQPVYSTGSVIRETYGNGFVYQIDALDQNFNAQTVWTGIDQSQPGAPAEAIFTWVETPNLTYGLKIYTDTNHNLTAWEEIDAIQMFGNPAAPTPTSVPSPLPVAGSGMALAWSRRLRQRIRGRLS
jgi:hypothetical protein